MNKKIIINKQTKKSTCLYVSKTKETACSKKPKKGVQYTFHEAYITCKECLIAMKSIEIRESDG